MNGLCIGAELHCTSTLVSIPQVSAHGHRYKIKISLYVSFISCMRIDSLILYPQKLLPRHHFRWIQNPRVLLPTRSLNRPSKWTSRLPRPQPPWPLALWRTRLTLQAMLTQEDSLLRLSVVMIALQRLRGMQTVARREGSISLIVHTRIEEVHPWYGTNCTQI